MLDEGVNLIPSVRFFYDSLRANRPETSLYFTGMYMSSVLRLRYRSNFRHPVDAQSENLLLLHQNIDLKWFFKEQLSVDFPLKVWDRETAGFYSLGGFNTIRGDRFFIYHIKQIKQPFQSTSLRGPTFGRAVFSRHLSQNGFFLF